MPSAGVSTWRLANSMGPLHALHSLTQRGLAFWAVLPSVFHGVSAEERHVLRRWTANVEKENPPFYLLFNLETISMGVRRGCSVGFVQGLVVSIILRP